MQRRSAGSRILPSALRRARPVPLRVVRGVSNEVGVRDPASWRIPAALAAARRLAIELLTSDEPWSADPGTADA